MPITDFAKNHPRVLTLLASLPFVVGIGLYLFARPFPDRWLYLSGGLLVATGVLALLPPAHFVRRWVAIAAAVVLLVDWVGVFVHPERKDLACGVAKVCSPQTCAGCTNPTAAEQSAFLRLEYDTVVQEVRQRATQEQTLFALKFTLVGAILGAMFVLFKRSDNAELDMEKLRQNALVAAFFWAAVLIAAVLDVRAQFNVAFIAELGNWAFLQETRSLGIGPNALGWEHHLGAMLGASFYPIIRLSGTLLTVVLFAVAIALFVPAQPKEPPLEQTDRLCLGAGFAAFVMFALISKSFQPAFLLATAHAIAWAGLGYLSLHLSIKAH
jgi:hypothetical protein